jgi:hypothetical protein
MLFIEYDIEQRVKTVSAVGKDDEEAPVLKRSMRLTSSVSQAKLRTVDSNTESPSTSQLYSMSREFTLSIDRS